MNIQELLKKPGHFTSGHLYITFCDDEGHEPHNYIQLFERPKSIHSDEVWGQLADYIVDLLNDAKERAV